MNLLWTAILLITSIVDNAQTRETETIFDSRENLDREILVLQLRWLSKQNFDNNNFVEIQLAADDASKSSRSFSISFELTNEPKDSPSLKSLSFPAPRIKSFQIEDSTERATRAMWDPFSVKFNCSDAKLWIGFPGKDELHFIFESINKNNEKWKIKWHLEKIKDSNQWKIVVFNPRTAGADSTFSSSSKNYMKIELVGPESFDLDAALTKYLYK